MTTLGKALGGGVPVSAFCGRHDLMNLIASGTVIEAGTFNGHPLSMAAVVATLDALGENDGAVVYGRMEALGTLLSDGLLRIAAQHGEPMLIQGFPTCHTLLFTDRPRLRNHSDTLGIDLSRGGRFFQLLLNRGVECYGRFCISAAHTERDIHDTLDRVDDALAAL